MNVLLHLKANHPQGNLTSVAEQETSQLRASALTFSVCVHEDEFNCVLASMFQKNFLNKGAKTCHMWVEGVEDMYVTLLPPTPQPKFS